MKKIFIIAICTILGACASNNKNILDPNSSHYGKAFIKYNFNNLRMESVNGKKYEKVPLFSMEQEGAYVEPGYTTVEIAPRYSKYTKKLCFIAKPKHTISITLYPDLSNQYTYPYAIKSYDKSPFGNIIASYGIPCRP